MKFAILFVIIIVIASLLGTVFVTRNAEENYGQSTKQNVKNLSAIYIVLLLSLLIGVTWYAVAVL
ncbi:cytochrome c biogenesis protein ResB [Bacillus sp. TL12]|uniref:cytochrome c biogenesis protein ResB n=1 Tax=Bacillus sp. TL12 TaxID=2894756 RepID=UPI001F51A14F|nr:cytochrome c biogenesis protein ResB [Bacillus sp. TL12]MCI0766110.1 cytochrome c biogenesis protein ResB [Bacillus sp. TL12]